MNPKPLSLYFLACVSRTLSLCFLCVLLFLFLPSKMLLLRSKVVCVTEDARSADTRHWVSQHSVNTRWVSQRSVGPAGPRSVGRHSVGPNVRPHEGLRLGWSKHGQLDRDSSLARSGRSHGVISVTDHMSNANLTLGARLGQLVKLGRSGRSTFGWSTLHLSTMCQHSDQ
jgi:hypothetical protein